MSLLNLAYYARHQSQELTDVEWVGKVVENVDPKGLGRVKVEVEGMLEGAPELLPWCHIKKMPMIGGGVNLSFFSVPNIDSEVLVSFESGVYHPYVVGILDTEKTKNPNFTLEEDYPTVYGFEDETGTKLVINRNKKSIELFHGPTQNQFIWDGEGNETRIIKGNRTTTVEGDDTLTVNKNRIMNVKDKYTMTSTDTSFTTSNQFTSDSKITLISGSDNAQFNGGSVSINGTPVSLN
ncbi:Rhs element Vgr protein [Vibrio phage Va2]|nr:Rhs element Vgr protein [Vibrio phage Va2]